MKNGKSPINFDPAAALLINQPKIEFSMSVDLTSGRTSFEQTAGPPLNILAVVDLLATQIQTLMRDTLMQGPPKQAEDKAGEKDEEKTQ